VCRGCAQKLKKRVYRDCRMTRQGQEGLLSLHQKACIRAAVPAGTVPAADVLPACLACGMLLLWAWQVGDARARTRTNSGGGMIAVDACVRERSRWNVKASTKSPPLPPCPCTHAHTRTHTRLHAHARTCAHAHGHAIPCSCFELCPIFNAIEVLTLTHLRARHQRGVCC